MDVAQELNRIYKYTDLVLRCDHDGRMVERSSLFRREARFPWRDRKEVGIVVGWIEVGIQVMISRLT
jgi:hypothetical protein